MGIKEKEMGVKEKYQELEKKHKLPSFSELDRDFEVSSIEEEKFLLREIRRKIVEKIELYAKLLSEWLNPEATISNMHESKLFTEKERRELFQVYKRLMFFDRYSIETAAREDDEKSAEFINDVFKEWNDLKENISVFVKKAKESWTEEVDVKEELGYMG
jgi:hypothetical protein